MDTLASQNLDLVTRDSPKKQKAENSSITYESLLQRKKKKKTPIHQQDRESCSNDEVILPRKN